jgi:hypothetical protein
VNISDIEFLSSRKILILDAMRGIFAFDFEEQTLDENFGLIGEPHLQKIKYDGNILLAI